MSFSRNSDRLESDVFRRYSRTCNLLLKQGRVPSHLRALCIDLLGSDDEREAFFKDFNMKEDLLEFYRSKKRYHEVYHLLLESEQLRSALEVAVTYASQCAVPEHDLERLFHFVHVESFTQSAGSGIGFKDVPDLFDTIPTPSSLADAAGQWRHALYLVTNIVHDSVFPDLGRIKNSAIKDFLCLFVSLHLSSIVRFVG